MEGIIYMGKWIVTNLKNPLRTYLRVKKYFRRPHIKFYIGKLRYGFPVWKGNMGSLLTIWCNDILWKSKYDFPSFEYSPSINIVFFKKWQIYMYFTRIDDLYNIGSKIDIDYIYWEAILWCVYYNLTPDKAIAECVWENSEDVLSDTSKILKSKYRKL